MEWNAQSVTGAVKSSKETDLRASQNRRCSYRSSVYYVTAAVDFCYTRGRFFINTCAIIDFPKQCAIFETRKEQNKYLILLRRLRQWSAEIIHQIIIIGTHSSCQLVHRRQARTPHPLLESVRTEQKGKQISEKKSESAVIFTNDRTKNSCTLLANN